MDFGGAWWVEYGNAVLPKWCIIVLFAPIWSNGVLIPDDEKHQRVNTCKYDIFGLFGLLKKWICDKFAKNR